LLVDHFITRNSLKTGKEITGISKEVMDIFYKYSWPGNVRELKSVIEYGFVVCDKTIILKEHLLPSLLEQQSLSSRDDSFNKQNKSTLDEEKKRLIQALKQAEGNRTKVAKILGVSRVTVWKKMKKYGLI